MDAIILNSKADSRLIESLVDFLYYDEFGALHLRTHDNAEGLTSILTEYNAPPTEEELGRRDYRDIHDKNNKGFASGKKKEDYLLKFKTFFVGNITMNPRNLQFLEQINLHIFRFDTVNVQFLPAVCGTTPIKLQFTPPVANMTFVLDTDFTLFLKGANINHTSNIGECALLIDITRLRRLEIHGRIGKFMFNGDAYEHIERPQFEKVFSATYPDDRESLEMVRMFDHTNIVDGVLSNNIIIPQGSTKKSRANIMRKHSITDAKGAKDAKAKGVTKKRRSKKTKKRNSLYRKGLFKNLRRN
jgi:hypothetical protein